MDRMSPLDASFLHIENDANHMHIGSVGIFDSRESVEESDRIADAWIQERLGGVVSDVTVTEGEVLFSSVAGAGPPVTA